MFNSNKSNSNKQSLPFTTIGLSSLLVVFVVLCLITFACLSMSTAKTDYDFAKKNAAHKTDYYRACNEAEEYLNALALGDTNDSSRQFRINGTQALTVEVQANGASYEVSKWQVVSTAKHDYKQTLQLIK